MLQNQGRRSRYSSAVPGSPTLSMASGLAASNAGTHAGTALTATSETGVVEWSKTSSYAVSRLIPTLRQVFARGTTFTGSAWDGHGLLLSTDSAYIFPYTSTSSTPPILTFPLPRGEESVFGALIPGPSHDPGLLVVLPSSGQIGFWPALNSALAPRSGIESRVQLSGGERVVKLCNAGAAGVVLATSSGRLCHVSLRDAAGKPAVSVSSMSPGGGWLGALMNVASRREIVAVRAGQAVSREQRQVLSISKRGILAIWEVSRGANNRNLLEVDLAAVLAAEGMRAVLDVASYPLVQNGVLVLVETTEGAIKLVGIQLDEQATPQVFTTRSLPAIDGAEMYLPMPGKTVFVVGTREVYMLDMAGTAKQEAQAERIKLADDIDIVGAGIEDQLKSKRNPGIVLLTRRAGVLRIELFDGQLAHVATPAKSRLEQAVFFSALDGNPIDFAPPPKDADRAAIELSAQILRGETPFLPQSTSLTDALHARVLALQNLASYAAAELQPATLQRLRQDAEQVYAASLLWKSVDRRIDGDSILSKLLKTAAESVDPTRDFFQHRIADIASLIDAAHRASVEAIAVLDGAQAAAVVLEANEIVLAILLSATQYRDGHTEYRAADAGRHSADQHAHWTSAAAVLKSCGIQYELTRRLVAGLKDGATDTLRDQLVGLAGINCRLNEDMIKSAAKGSPEHAQLEAAYLAARPKWLRGLVESGRTEQALEIGERYRDFGTLVEICHDEGESASDEDVVNAVVRRLEWYLHTFGYDFAAVLWQYYLDRRQYRNLLHEFPNYRHHLTRFFDDNPHPTVSWMNDVLLDEYAKAGAALLRSTEPRIEKSRVQLSIAKLALLVDSEEAPIAVERRLHRLNVLKARADAFKQIAAQAIDVDAALDLVLAATAPNLAARRTSTASKTDVRLRSLTESVIKLLQDESPSPEDAVDLLSQLSLTPPDASATTGVSTSAHFDALQILACTSADEVHDAVATSWRRTVWRRCYGADDWARIADTAGKSDAEVRSAIEKTALFATIRAALAHNADPGAPDFGVVILPPRDCYHQATSSFAASASASASTVTATAAVGSRAWSKEENAAFGAECVQESELLDELEGQHQLHKWYEATVRAAQDSLNEVGGGSVPGTAATTIAPSVSVSASASRETNGDEVEQDGFVRVDGSDGDVMVE